MQTFVLDTSAVIRFLDKEEGGARVRSILREATDGKCYVTMSAVNWGELVGFLHRRYGSDLATRILERLMHSNIQLVSATPERAARSALIKNQHKMPFADAFGVELTSDSRDRVLVTADFDVKAAEQDIAIEFLPAKRGKPPQ